MDDHFDDVILRLKALATRTLSENLKPDLASLNSYVAQLASLIKPRGLVKGASLPKGGLFCPDPACGACKGQFTQQMGVHRMDWSNGDQAAVEPVARCGKCGVFVTLPYFENMTAVPEYDVYNSNDLTLSGQPIRSGFGEVPINDMATKFALACGEQRQKLKNDVSEKIALDMKEIGRLLEPSDFHKSIASVLNLQYSVHQQRAMDETALRMRSKSQPLGVIASIEGTICKQISDRVPESDLFEFVFRALDKVEILEKRDQDSPLEEPNRDLRENWGRPGQESVSKVDASPVQQRMSKDLAYYKRSLNKARLKIQTIQKDLKVCESEKGHDVRIIAQLASKLEELKNKKNNCDEVLEKFKKLKEHYSKALKQIQKQKDKIAQLEGEKEALKKEKEALEGQKLELERELERQKGELEKENTILALHREAIMELERENEGMVEAIMEMERKNEGMREAIMELVDDIEALKNTLDKGSRENKRLNDELERVQGDLNKKKEEKEKVEKDIENLKNEMDKNNQKLLDDYDGYETGRDEPEGYNSAARFVRTGTRTPHTNQKTQAERLARRVAALMVVDRALDSIPPVEKLRKACTGKRARIKWYETLSRCSFSVDNDIPLNAFWIKYARKNIDGNFEGGILASARVVVGVLDGKPIDWPCYAEVKESASPTEYSFLGTNDTKIMSKLTGAEERTCFTYEDSTDEDGLRRYYDAMSAYLRKYARYYTRDYGQPDFNQRDAIFKILEGEYGFDDGYLKKIYDDDEQLVSSLQKLKGFARKIWEKLQIKWQLRDPSLLCELHWQENYDAVMQFVNNEKIIDEYYKIRVLYEFIHCGRQPALLGLDVRAQKYFTKREIFPEPETHFERFIALCGILRDTIVRYWDGKNFEAKIPILTVPEDVLRKVDIPALPPDEARHFEVVPNTIFVSAAEEIKFHAIRYLKQYFGRRETNLENEIEKLTKNTGNKRLKVLYAKATACLINYNRSNSGQRATLVRHHVRTALGFKDSLFRFVEEFHASYNGSSIISPK